VADPLPQLVLGVFDVRTTSNEPPLPYDLHGEPSASLPPRRARCCLNQAAAGGGGNSQSPGDDE